MTITNRPETVLNLQIFPIYSLGKNPEILLFPLLSYTRAKSRKYVIFATSNGYSSNTKERESQVHMAN